MVRHEDGIRSDPRAGSHQYCTDMCVDMCVGMRMGSARELSARQVLGQKKKGPAVATAVRTRVRETKTWDRPHTRVRTCASP